MHNHGLPSVGMKLACYLQPDHVSFEFIKIREAGAVAKATGQLGNLDELPHSKFGGFNACKIVKHVKGKGSLCGGLDKAQIEDGSNGVPGPPWPDSGWFHWQIPWQFKTTLGGRWLNFVDIKQEFFSNTAGDVSVIKGQSGKFDLADPSTLEAGTATATAKLFDPTISY